MSVMQAIAVINEARRRGLSVPRDLSVVGYNDIPDAERSDPPLTTVDALGVQKGQQCAEGNLLLSTTDQSDHVLVCSD